MTSKTFYKEKFKAICSSNGVEVLPDLWWSIHMQLYEAYEYQFFTDPEEFEKEIIARFKGIKKVALYDDEVVKNGKVSLRIASSTKRVNPIKTGNELPKERLPSIYHKTVKPMEEPILPVEVKTPKIKEKKIPIISNEPNILDL